MSTYVKLEANNDGELLQSSYVVPPNGVLPRPHHTANHPNQAKVYSLSLFAPMATAALDGGDYNLQITALYFPPNLHGKGLLKLLIPITIIGIGLTGLYSLLFAQSALHTFDHILVTMLISLVTYFILIYPSAWWAAFMYRQGAPSFSTQRKIQERYPNIPIYHDLDLFMLDTKTIT